MDAEIDVLVEDPRWTECLPALEDLTRTAVGAALTREGRDGPVSLSVLFDGDARLRDLNARFRGKDRATNVLSFPADLSLAEPGAAPPLGDIALAFETVSGEAELADKPLSEHLCHLIVHGTLHLLGYDHEEDAEADRMETREIEILAILGIRDPYTGDTPAQR